MTQRRQQWFVEIWKGTTYRRANHFTGSLLWKVSDWHFKVEVDSIESKSFHQSPKLLPRSRRPRHYKYFHFNSLSNSFLRNVLFKLCKIPIPGAEELKQHACNQHVSMSSFWKTKMFSVSFLSERIVWFLCGLTSERVCVASLQKGARPYGWKQWNLILFIFWQNVGPYGQDLLHLNFWLPFLQVQ